MIKKTVCIILACILACSFTSCKKSGEVSVFDKDGELLAKVSDVESVGGSIENKSLISFIEFALSEALITVQNENGCTRTKAKSILESGYSVYTAFDKTVFESITEHYNDNGIGDTEFGCVITDTSGTVLATYSSESENIAVKKLNPYSAFKPLSVYAPALDSNVICWSSVYTDSPYKKITSKNSESADWPQNANNQYSMKDVCICEGIKKSLNTVAVKCLADYGVLNSIEFLQKNFGFKLKDEQKKASMTNPDEVIGNIAMGYISEGCSPVDMAGYYQIFANGGKYTAPHTVTRIADNSGSDIYVYTPKTKQVIKETTAFIMNNLLQGVTENGGTGTEARINGTAVGGKTGTDIKDSGNWFVGFTPDYVCSVWHGFGMPKNTCPAVFSSVMSEVSANTPKKTDKFPTAAGVKKEAYCTESGMLLKYTCKKMDVGYYTSDNVPDVCNIH